jgi:hypothetical protein
VKKAEELSQQKFSRVISAFIDWVMTWGVSIILIPLQALPICYSLCLVYRIPASSVSQNPPFLSDLALMLIIALNSIFIFLYARQFREPKSHECRKSSSR